MLVIGSIHGDEQAGLRVVRRLRPREHLPADLDLWLVPTVNPDGTAPTGVPTPTGSTSTATSPTGGAPARAA